MLNVPQFLSSGQSAGFTKSPSETCSPEPASGSSESSASGSDATASSVKALPHSAISSLIRFRVPTENLYSSRRLRLKEKLHVSIFSDLLDCLLVG